MTGMAGKVPDPRAIPESGAIPWPLELEPEAIRERLRWARRRGHPRFLWPELDAREWRAALRSIADAVTTVLRGGSAVLDGEPRALGIAGYTSGTGPLLGYWIERGRLDAAGPVRNLFELHLAHGRQRVDVQTAILRRALSGLAEPKIEPVVLKSAAHSALLFPEPGTRPALDVDLVVPPDRYEAAENALASAGFICAGSQRSPRKSDWRVADLPAWPRSIELLHSGSQYAIDLHSSLTRDFFGIRRVTVEGVTEPADHPAGPIRVLAPAPRLAFHALHATEGLDSLTLIRLIEVVLMVRRDFRRPDDWNAFLGVLDRSGATRFVWPAFALAERLVPGTVDARILKTLERAATPAMRRVVSDLHPADAQRLDLLSLRERFMWCRGPIEHARRLAHMLFPAPAGRSPARLFVLYGERAARLLRGNVRLDRSPPQSDD